MTSFEDLGEHSNAGIQLREPSFKGRANSATMHLNGQGRNQVTYRNEGDRRKEKTGSGSGAYAERTSHWMKLVRNHNYVVAYFSEDGTKWERHGSARISLPETVYVGMFLSSGMNDFTVEATYDNVSVVQDIPDVEIVSPADGDTFNPGDDILLEVNAADPEDALQSVRFYAGQTLLSEDTAAPYAFKWEDVPMSTTPMGTTVLAVEATDADGHISRHEITVEILPPDAGHGLLGAYHLGWGHLKEKLKYRQIDPIVHNLPEDRQKGGIRWTGYIKPEFSETYTFRTEAGAEEEFRLWIDDKQVLDARPRQTVSGEVELVAGQMYEIKAEFESNVNYRERASLLWSSDSVPEDVVPMRVLYAAIAPPKGLTATHRDGEVWLNWLDNEPENLKGYTVFRSTTADGPYTEIATGLTESRYFDTGLDNGTTYYYAVAANSTIGKQSSQSRKVSASPQAVTVTHPSLYFKAEDLPGLRAKFNDPMFADYRELMLKNAGKAGDIWPNIWAYIFTDDPQYRDLALAAVDDVLDTVNLDQFEGAKGSQVALVYDTLFDQLTKQQKSDMENLMIRTCGDWRYNGWWETNLSNTSANGARNAGLSALAVRGVWSGASKLIDQTAERAAKAFKAARDDGSYIEGPTYWQYGLTPILELGHALQNVEGSHRGLLDAERVANSYRFVETMLAGDGRGYFPFNNSNPLWCGWGICADHGRRFDNDLMRWMTDKMVEEALDGARTYKLDHGIGLALLWRDSVEVPDFPGVPTLSVLEDTNWGVLRSESAYKPGISVGIKGDSGPWTHHYQEDAGSFTLYAGGELFLHDPCYPRQASKDHSLPLVDGAGVKNRTEAPLVDAQEGAAVRHIAVELNNAYGDKVVERATRSFTLVGDDALIVLDDIVPAGDGAITTQFQCGYPVTVQSANAAIITGQARRMGVQCFGPTVTLDAVQRDWGKNWNIYRVMGIKWFSLSGAYSADAAKPLVTVFTPMDMAGDLPAIDVTYGEDLITVSLPGGKNVKFTNTPSGWKYAAAKAWAP